MQTAWIRNTLRATGVAITLTAAAFTILAPAAHAAIDMNSTPAAIAQALPSADPRLLTGEPPVARSYQGILPIVPYGHAPLPNLYQSPKFFHYYDYFRGWGIMRVDFVKFNWNTDSKLIKVTLFHKVYTPFGYYWVASYGSGCLNDGLYAFSLDRQSDGLGVLFFEGKVNEWSSYHPLGDPHHPRWWYITPY